MNDISTDTQDIADRIEPWEPPNNPYSSTDIPDTELLRVHAIRLAESFREIRGKWQEAEKRTADLRENMQFRHIVTFLKNSGLRLSAAWMVRRLFGLTIAEAIKYVDGCHVKNVCGDFVLTEDSPHVSTEHAQ